MSTRSRIAVKNGTEYKSVYCHFDGYPAGVGVELKSRFNSFEKASDLVKLGDLSTVCDKVVAYHRDRGEPWTDVQPIVDFTLTQLKQSAKNSGGEYLYVFEGTEWVTYSLY